MKTIKERIPALLVVIGLILYTALLIIICGIGFSNKYEDEITKLKLENKKLEYNNHELKNSVEILLNDKEAECHCGWYEDFYYEHMEEVGANE